MRSDATQHHGLEATMSDIGLPFDRPLPPERRRPEYWEGARAVLPLAAVIGLLGLPTGLLATSAGLDALAMAVMSATTFAGSAQLAALSVLAAGGGVGAAILAATMLNARYLAMGLAAAPSLGGGLGRRLLAAQLLVDESWAVAHLGQGRFSQERLIGAGLVLYATHLATTTLGAACGRALGDPLALGLDAAFPALFLILLWPQVQERRQLRVALLGAGIALGLTPFTPPGVPILAAAAAAGWAWRSR